jgi:RNA polymerase sigma-70 factor (ECF subfamily)
MALSFSGTERSHVSGKTLAFDSQGVSDTEIMLRVKTGNHAAYAVLVDRFREPMLNFMYRMSDHAASAEALTQEAFVRLHRARKTYTRTVEFTTWLYRIAIDVALNPARDSEPGLTIEATSDLAEPQVSKGTGSAPDRSTTTDVSVTHRERLQAVRREIQALPELQRIAVILHKYQRLDSEQISEVLTLSELATKSLLFHAYCVLHIRLNGL